MRSISADALAKLAQQTGTEPINIVEIEWYAGATPMLYADRDIPIPGGGVIRGAIVELGDLDDAIDVAMQNSPSQQISLTLDDTDGAIKAIFDKYDLHKQPVRLYQWFNGLDLDDKFLVFAGLINTPVSWNERDRTVKVTVLSHIEDKEFGFSAEEGNFPYIPSDMVGKAWPAIFGLVYDYPALKINMAVEGTTLTGCGILAGQEEYLGSPLYENGTNVDRKKLRTIARESRHANFLLVVSECWSLVDAVKSKQYLDQANAIYDKIGAELARMQAQEECALARRQEQITLANLLGEGPNPIQILGGEDFPQNKTVTIQIKDGLFTGYFKGEEFYCTSRENPYLQALVNAQVENEVLAAQEQAGYGPYPYATPRVCLPPPMPPEPFYYHAPVPCGSGCGDFNDPCNMTWQGWDIYTYPEAPAWVDTRPIVKQFWADAGSKVRLYTDPSVTYIASITPGTVLAVKAYQMIDGVRRLTVVPNNYYTIETQNYGSITAVQIKLAQPLSTIWYTDGNGMQIQGWSDELYVTFQSSVGPNVVDILTYIIDNYTELTWDPTSFNYVKTKMAPFPANFPLLSRKNVLQLLKEICFQSRCALWVEDNVLYLKYLPEQPTPVDAITVSDIDAEHGMEIEYTRTEDIVTKMNVRWNLGYVPGGQFAGTQADSTQYMILRHNVAKYGLYEKDYDWYIFNQPDVVLKMATFWLIRFSNPWKRVKFRSYLTKLNLEAFDCVTFNAPGYIASGPVPVVIERAAYNSAENCIEFECATPIRAGAMAQDPFYWPAALPVTTTWPPQTDIDSNNAGGGGIGIGVGGNLPVGDTSGITSTSTVFVGGPNVVFRGRSDWGDRTPTDLEFQFQQLATAEQFQAVWAVLRPIANLQAYRLPESDPMTVTPDPTELVIDLAKTKFTDSSSPNQQPPQFGYLRSMLALGNNQDVQIDISRCKVQDSTQGGSSGGSSGSGSGSSGSGGSTGSGPGMLSDLMKVVSGTLMVDGTKAKVVTADKTDGAVFDFKYDTNGQKVGAGTAFLQSP